jgi:lipopolysaccharide biosynthesis glycosyltransferase
MGPSITSPGIIRKGRCQKALETIHLAVAVNDNYAPHLAVMLTSIQMNHASNHSFCFYILDGGNLSSESKHKLLKSLDRFNQTIYFLEMDSTLFSNCVVQSYFSIEAYYRLSIPDLLDESIHKVIYLDSDIILNRDIAYLWETDVSNHCVGAVYDKFAYYRCKDLSIPPEHGYFNSGVLLINMDKWRENKISKKAFEYLDQQGSDLEYPDQDTLNVLLHDKWLKLSEEWNSMSIDLYHSAAKPSLIHFVSDNKPWRGNPPRMLEYYKYREFTVWD